MPQFSDAQVQELAIDLLRADSEEAVVQILEDAQLWNDSGCWRLLGDDENNFKTVGAQQARPAPALVEKLINSVDARLTGACLRAGIDPTSPQAPRSIVAARKTFFGALDRTELAKGITLAITGARPQHGGMPCLTICDTGEGQTPAAVPDTFMSIDRKNKLRIPFVQGKFNMGGTGALMFCGKRKLQLLITRRDPEVLCRHPSLDPRAGEWAVTIVRRETPPEGPGQVRNPYFKYLAPIGADTAPARGEVLSFSAPSLDLMPLENKAYARPMQWGSCIKLYDYDMRGFKGHILRTGGLLARLEVLLPEVALPIRAHECRDGLRGHAGSFDTNLIGLRERLEASRGDSLEPGYPASLTLNVQGQPLTARVYAFKGDNANRYRVDQGVVFTINGQTHGWFPKSFFERKRVKMGRLAKSLLIVVDSTEISVDARADLFKNSRDRLSGGELRRDIEEELETQVANHPGLRELRERRRREELTEKLSEAKPLEDVLKAILKTSPSLSKLFLMGQRLSAPFRTSPKGTGGGDGGGTEGVAGDFKGKRHPSFFRFEKLKDGDSLQRTCEQGRRCRLKFVTDVENEYFFRDRDRGRYHVEVVAGALEGRELTTSVNLFNGIANWNVAIPEEDVAVGDTLTLQFSVEDDVLADPIVNIAKVTIAHRNTHEPGDSGERRKRTGGKDPSAGGAGSGKGNKGESDEGPPAGIELPRIHKVRKNGWEERGFDEHSACTVIDEGSGDEGDDRSVYEFYVNVDNIFLQTDMKHGDRDAAIIETKFIYGNVLVGLALIHDAKRTEAARRQGECSESEEEEEPIARRIEQVTRALGPFLVPMVDYLGGLDAENVSELSQAGDED